MGVETGIEGAGGPPVAATNIAFILPTLRTCSFCLLNLLSLVLEKYPFIVLG